MVTESFRLMKKSYNKGLNIKLCQSMFDFWQRHILGHLVYNLAASLVQIRAGFGKCITAGGQTCRSASTALRNTVNELQTAVNARGDISKWRSRGGSQSRWQAFVSVVDRVTRSKQRRFNAKELGKTKMSVRKAAAKLRIGMLGADVLKLLRKKPSLWQEPLLVTENCLIFKTKNIIQSNYTFLSSATMTTASGIEDSLPNLLDGIKRLGSPEYISILCISGTHGNLEGLSGFSDLSLLERKFYEETCKLLGIKEVTKPDPKAQPLDENAEDDAILRDPLYRMMKYNALDIKHFHKNEEGLIEYVRAFDPNAIVLDWCFTKDGDVAKILCKSGILSELWLKHERTSMVGITDGRWISLDQEQTQYLKEGSKRVGNNEVKHFVLFGGHGSGKTVLGVQTAKIVLGKLKEKYPNNNVLFVVHAGEAVLERSPLLQNIEGMLKEEDCIKHYYTLKTLQEESGIEKEPYWWRLNDILRGIQIVFEKKYNDPRINKVVLIDEAEPVTVFYKDKNWCSLEDQFDKNESMYTITCVTPFSTKEANIIVKEKLKKMEEKRLLENQIMIRQLKVSYRNSSQIQLFYNVYQAHFNSLAKDKDRDILTGEMKQPEMDPNHSSNQDGETNLLPLGPKPILLLSKKEFKKWSDNDIKEIQEKVVNMMDMNTNSFAALCFNREGKECRLCQKLNEEYQTKDDSTIKMGYMKIGDKWYDNVKGCEKDQLVIHHSGLFNYNNQFEYISRARKRLILIMDSKDLESEKPFFEIMKELRNHSETCKNDMCKEHGWNKKEVVEVVEVDKKDKLCAVS